MKRALQAKSIYDSDLLFTISFRATATDEGEILFSNQRDVSDCKY